MTDLMAIMGHASDALQAATDAARWHHAQGTKRGLTGRGMRALAGAATRADELGTELLALAGSGYKFGASDCTWLATAFRKVQRSRATVRLAAEGDFHSLPGKPRDNINTPEHDQLGGVRSITATGHYEALSAVARIVGDAIQAMLSGVIEPTRSADHRGGRTGAYGDRSMSRRPNIELPIRRRRYNNPAAAQQCYAKRRMAR